MQSQQDRKGIWIDESILQIKDLTLQEKVLYASIKHLDDETKGCWASNKYFSNLIKLTPQQTADIISSLVIKGYISRQVIKEEGNKRILRVINDRQNTPLEGKKPTHSRKKKNLLLENHGNPNSEITNSYTGNHGNSLPGNLGKPNRKITEKTKAKEDVNNSNRFLSNKLKKQLIEMGLFKEVLIEIEEQYGKGAYMYANRDVAEQYFTYVHEHTEEKKFLHSRIVSKSLWEEFTKDLPYCIFVYLSHEQIKKQHDPKLHPFIWR